MDIFTKEKRSWVMSRVKNRDTKPELLVRTTIREMGIHFRTSPKNLPGKPDIVLGPQKKAIFVHGCFWHHHNGCGKATLPKNNARWWQEKISQNEKRDRRVNRMLLKQGWRTLVLWECRLRDPAKLSQVIRHFIAQKRITPYHARFN
jgi:DNA mismatch endonuclease (patch repair protein)